MFSIRFCYFLEQKLNYFSGALTSIIERNNVIVTGKGDHVMLFAHGFGCSQEAWGRITSAFEDDFKLVLFDYIGAGRSDISAYDKEKYNSLDGYAGDIIEICKSLNISNAVFVGHSVSSMIGALAAIKEPSLFKKLIFIGPSPSYMNSGDYVGGFDKDDIDSLLEIMEDDYLGWAKIMAPKMVANPDNPESSEEMENFLCTTNHEILKDFARVTFFSDNRKDLANIPVESFTLQCSEDIIAPLEVGQYIKDNTPGNKMVVLQATGHCPHMSAPEETIKAIRSFL